MGRYITPDKQLDLSTCLFPDTTWVIKNYAHTGFNTEVEPFLLAVCHTDNVNVNTFAQYPQALVQAENKYVIPMTEDNWNVKGIVLTEGATPVVEEQTDFWNNFGMNTEALKKPFASLINFFRYLRDSIRVLLSYLKASN